MNINIDVPYEIGDKIAVSLLKEAYQQTIEDIKIVKTKKKPLGIISWDSYKDELKYLKKQKKHFEYVLKYFNGSVD